MSDQCLIEKFKRIAFEEDVLEYRKMSILKAKHARFANFVQSAY